MELMLRQAAVLVTGSSRGIGRGIALAFAREGAKVAICGRDQDALDATLMLLRNAGAQCVSIRADLSHAEDCVRVVDESVALLGGLQIVVNNAAVSADKAPRFLAESTDAQIMGRV